MFGRYSFAQTPYAGTATTNVSVNITGMEAVVSLSSVTVIPSISVSVTGVSITVELDDCLLVNLWGGLEDCPAGTWTEIVCGSADWAAVDNAQTASWTEENKICAPS